MTFLSCIPRSLMSPDRQGTFISDVFHNGDVIIHCTNVSFCGGNRNQCRLCCYLLIFVVYMLSWQNPTKHCYLKKYHQVQEDCCSLSNKLVHCLGFNVVHCLGFNVVHCLGFNVVYCLWFNVVHCLGFNVDHCLGLM